MNISSSIVVSRLHDISVTMHYNKYSGYKMFLAPCHKYFIKLPYKSQGSCCIYIVEERNQ